MKQRLKVPFVGVGLVAKQTESSTHLGSCQVNKTLRVEHMICGDWSEYLNVLHVLPG